MAAAIMKWRGAVLISQLGNCPKRDKKRDLEPNLMKSHEIKGSEGSEQRCNHAWVAQWGAWVSLRPRNIQKGPEKQNFGAAAPLPCLLCLS